MLDVLRDSVWQFWGVVATLVVAVASAVWAIRFRRRKVLTYHVITSTPLLNSATGVREDMVVLYKNQAVNNPHLLLLQIRNTGNTEVTAADYHHPIAFVLRSGVTVLNAWATPVPVFPVGLTFETRDWSTAVVLERVPLNPSDQIQISIVTDGIPQLLRVDEHVIGTKVRNGQVPFSLPEWTGLAKIDWTSFPNVDWISIGIAVVVSGITAVVVVITLLTLALMFISNALQNSASGP